MEIYNKKLRGSEHRSGGSPQTQSLDHAPSCSGPGRGRCEECSTNGTELPTRKARLFDSVRAGPAQAAGEGVGRVHCRPHSPGRRFQSRYHWHEHGDGCHRSLTRSLSLDPARRALPSQRARNLKALLGPPLRRRRHHDVAQNSGSGLKGPCTCGWGSCKPESVLASYPGPGDHFQMAGVPVAQQPQQAYTVSALCGRLAVTVRIHSSRSALPEQAAARATIT